jgi:RsiW-degrading membrane proteinase PrsW (M82 family)
MYVLYTINFFFYNNKFKHADKWIKRIQFTTTTATVEYFWNGIIDNMSLSNVLLFVLNTVINIIFLVNIYLQMNQSLW